MSTQPLIIAAGRRPIVIAGAAAIGFILMLAAGPWWRGAEPHPASHLASVALLAALGVAALRGSALARKALLAGVSLIGTLALLRALRSTALPMPATITLSAATTMLALAAFELLETGRTKSS